MLSFCKKFNGYLSKYCRLKRTNICPHYVFILDAFRKRWIKKYNVRIVLFLKTTSRALEGVLRL